jgi:SAM-dependent methyltransferase
LSLDAESLSDEVGVVDGQLRCSACGSVYNIENGIARLMIPAHSPEDEHEIAIRDQEHFNTCDGPFVPPEDGWRSELMDRLEIPPHLAALKPLTRRTVLELGCGDGRFTMLMAGMEARVLAVDFSISALRQMARWLPSGIAPTAYRPAGRLIGTDLRGRVGLVQANINHFHVRPRSFDRALSATPLDSRDERMDMYRRISEALKDDGVLVSGTEHDDLFRRALGLPISRRYSSNGILIEHFDVPKFRRELTPYFLNIRFQPVRPRVPFAMRLPLPWAVALSRAVGAIPWLRQFGEILLARAERPARQPEEGQNRPGSKVAKRLLRWRMRRLGKEPIWGTDEVVSPP